MFCGKVFKIGRDVVAAICDSGLLGKELKSKQFCVQVSEGFYGSIRISEAEALKMMEGCTIGNLIGKNIVGLAKEHGFITEENVISIGGTPHAQFVKTK